MESIDGPFNEVVAMAIKIVEANPNVTVFQKYSCSGCGSRLTIEEPNTFHRTGSCDHCPVVTDIEKQGCGYLLVMGL